MALIHEKRLTLAQMNDLLTELDEELDRVGCDKVIPIRTLGGYAMLHHGLRRDNPTTPDIDTATPAFDAATRRARDAVAKRHDLTSHWLNNDTVLAADDEANWDDVSVSDAMIDAHYADAGLGLKHLDVQVADIDTLMRAKAMAACDIWSERGDKDMDDCLSILDHEGIDTYRRAVSRFPFLADDACSHFKSLYETAAKTSGMMRAASLQAQRDMLKSSGLDMPDFGSEIDDFAFGYEDDDLAFDEMGTLDYYDDWY